MKRSHYKKSMKKSIKKGRKGKRVNKGKKSLRKNIKRISFKKNRRSRRSRTKRGGSCGCGMENVMKGGMVSSPASGPVGYSWNGGNVASWPGAAASQGTNTQGATMSNHFAVSPNGIVVGGVNPAQNSNDLLKGGKRRRGRKGKNQKGGLFQEIVNLGRGAQYGINGGYFDLVGKQQPISQNPYPTEDQPIDDNSKFIGSVPSNVKQIYIDANRQVAKI